MAFTPLSATFPLGSPWLLYTWPRRYITRQIRWKLSFTYTLAVSSLRYLHLVVQNPSYLRLGFSEPAALMGNVCELWSRHLDRLQSPFPDRLPVQQGGERNSELIFNFIQWEANIFQNCFVFKNLIQGEAMTTLEDDKTVKTGVLIFTIGLVAFTVIILVSILITEISN